MDGDEKQIYTKEQREAIIDALRKLKAEGPEHRKFGICRNLESILWGTGRYDWGETHGMSYDFVSAYSEGWPRHSGVRAFPVGGFGESGAYLWSGAALTARLDLIDYMIDKLRSELE